MPVAHNSQEHHKQVVGDHAEEEDEVGKLHDLNNLVEVVDVHSLEPLLKKKEREGNHAENHELWCGWCGVVWGGVVLCCVVLLVVEASIRSRVYNSPPSRLHPILSAKTCFCLQGGPFCGRTLRLRAPSIACQALTGTPGAMSHAS